MPFVYQFKFSSVFKMNAANKLIGMFQKFQTVPLLKFGFCVSIEIRFIKFFRLRVFRKFQSVSILKLFACGLKERRL